MTKCRISQNKGSSSIHADYYQIQFGSEFVQDLFIFIAIPSACVLGLFLNTLVIRAVRQHREKDKFYQYMSINAVFNCLYCIIFLFYPINSCVDTLSSSFCSSIRTSTVTQLYKIVVVAYFGETIKMCANISYILININRYLMIHRDHNPTLEKIIKWDSKQVIGISLATSALLNIGHIFQYQLNQNALYRPPQEYISSYYYLFPETSYPAIVKYANQAFYIYLLLFYFFVNFGIFVIANMIVEVTLVREIIKDLGDKKKETDEAEGSNVLQFSFRQRRNNEIEVKAKYRLILMVVFGIIINLFFRLPEFFFLFATFNQLICVDELAALFTNYLMSFRYFWIDLVYFCYILTLSTNFLIYFLFDQKFKRTFAEKKHVKRRKLSNANFVMPI
jgi:hypothetical protein